MPREPRRNNQIYGNIESLEERLAMTAQPLGAATTLDVGAPADATPALTLHAAGLHALPLQLHASIDHLVSIGQHQESLPALEQHVTEPDFWRDTSLDNAADLDRQIEQLLSSAHGTTGWDNVSTDYGFDGTGQTVVVIDSGIAYDHYALGGGFGTSYRVVGGWDFTDENDADPYDDANTSGTSASHGTHIAGIIGSDDATHTGVAPGVDLVGLRVFNDSGAGYFSWVENALQWVHDNRDAFENPITTVNLSLGVSSWNASTIPSWANLEEEFAQLEQDGIFTTVSAGNSFTSYNTPGLSYPAASPYVVPVMSADDSGALSFYSQRLQRAIAAPGRGIVSTLPDYKGDSNGTADDFGAKSGTSMAAPYLAGASVLIREAMEFVGQTGITQDSILDHIRSTADTLIDSATSLSYDRLNLEAAIDALMPADDYGSTVQTAYSLGTVDNDTNVNLSGVISTLDDIDYFTFTADSDGEVTFTTNSSSHNLTAQWTVSGGSWEADGENCVITVAAGQTYSVGLSSSSGLGYFDVDVTAVGSQSSIDYTDWGAFDQGTVSDVAVVTEGWYRIEATRAGFMTVQTSYDGAGGTVSLEVYDADQTTVLGAGAARVDVTAAAGQTLYVRAVGDNPLVDFTMTNLVSRSGDVISVAGTAGNDEITFRSGDTHKVFVNGVFYGFQTSLASTIQIDGASGTDTVLLETTGIAAVQFAGVESVLNHDATAYALNADLGLNFSGDAFEDWGGMGEKWLRNSAGKWHFITPTGEFYTWDGKSDLSSSKLLATLSGAYHADLNLLSDAAQTVHMTSDQAVSIDAMLGLSKYAEYFEDWAGFGEKWVRASDGQWYFVTPTGDLYRWDNQTTLTDNAKFATLDSSFFDDPSLLHDASDGTAASFLQAAALDANLELSFKSSYFENWGGWGEKWVYGAGNQWYLLTEAGGVYHWNGRDITGSELVGVVDPIFFNNPAQLHDAAPAPSGAEIGEQSVAEESTLDVGLAAAVQSTQQQQRVIEQRTRENATQQNVATAVDAAMASAAGSTYVEDSYRLRTYDDQYAQHQDEALDAALAALELEDDALAMSRE